MPRLSLGSLSPCLTRRFLLGLSGGTMTRGWSVPRFCILRLGAKPHARLPQWLSVEICSEPTHAARGSAPVLCEVLPAHQNSQINRANRWPDSSGWAGLCAGFLLSCSFLRLGGDLPRVHLLMLFALDFFKLFWVTYDGCVLLKPIPAEGLLMRRQHGALIWKVHEPGRSLGEFTGHGQQEMGGGSDVVRD